jgi:hypothetical protein
MHFMEGLSDGDPTPDEIEGLAWWRGLSDTARVYWLEVANLHRRTGGGIAPHARPAVRCWPYLVI